MLRHLPAALLLLSPLALAGCGRTEPAPAPAPAPASTTAAPAPAAGEAPAANAGAPAAAPAAPAAPAPGSGAGKTLNILMWSEYIDPEIPKQFEQITGATVRIDVYEDSDAMQAKMQLQGGDKQYDLLIASDYKVPELAELKLIQPLDLSKVPNARNVSEAFQNPPYDLQGKFSLPYQWGTVGIMYRKDRLPEFEPTWALFFDPSRQPGPFLLIDDMRDCMASAFKHLGHSVNTTDPAIIKQAGDAILAAKNTDKCLGFQGGAAAAEQVASGQATMAIVYSGDAFRFIAEDEANLGYAIPREGGEWWIDAMLIPGQAEDADLAHQFINYILDPQIGGQLAEFNQYGTPNEAAKRNLRPETRANPAIYPPDDVMIKLEPLRDIGDAVKLYDEVWTAVKAR